MLTDVKYAVRWLRRSPGFALVAILSLGLGIGANTAMFSLVDAVLLRPLPVADPGALVDVFTSGGDGDEYATTSYPGLSRSEGAEQRFQRHDRLHADVCAAQSRRSRAAGDGPDRHLEPFRHASACGRLLGRMLQPADDEPGAERVVVISHRMWRSRLRRRSGGRRTSRCSLRGLAYTIVGVAPAAFTGVIPLFVPELWLPIAHVEEVEPAGINDNIPSPTGRTRIERRGSRWLFVKGRLKPGVTVAQARANVDAARRAACGGISRRPTGTSSHAAFATNDVRLLVPQAGGRSRSGPPA